MTVALAVDNTLSPGHFGQDDIDFTKLPKSRNTVVSLSKRVPAWHKASVTALYNILSLESNWDTYGAARINPKVAEAVTDLLTSIMQADSPTPQIVPSSNGNIQAEWHCHNIDLEIEVESKISSHVYYYDHLSKEEWDGVISQDLAPLVEFINILTRRYKQV